MPTINDFNYANIAHQEITKCQKLQQKIGPEDRGNKHQFDALRTLEKNWQVIYDSQLAAATIDGVKESIEEKITSLHNAYNNRNS